MLQLKTYKYASSNISKIISIIMLIPCVSNIRLIKNSGSESINKSIVLIIGSAAPVFMYRPNIYDIIVIINNMLNIIIFFRFILKNLFILFFVFL